jgi:acyl carrier protein
MTNMDEDLRRFVVDNFMFGQAQAGFSNDDSFLDNGIVDSTGVLELVAFLEEKYAITIQDQELVPDNLDSINKLVRFLERKLQRSA